MDIISYWALTRRTKSRTQKKSTTTQSESTTTEPDSTTTEPDSTTTESESTTTESESTTTESESTTTESESTTTELDSTTTELDSTSIQSNIIPTQQELITMTNGKEQSNTQDMDYLYVGNRPNIMSKQQLEERAGFVDASEKAENIVYARIVERINELDGLYKTSIEKNKDFPRIEEVTLLMQIVSYVARWLNKMYEDPQAVVDSEESQMTKEEKEKQDAEIEKELSKFDKFKNAPKKVMDAGVTMVKRIKAKSNRKKTLEALQRQIGRRLKEIGEEESKKDKKNRVLDSNLIALFRTEGNYVQSPTILFTHVMTQLLKSYPPESITGKKFSEEIFNYLIADNDVIGSTSVAMQASGRSFGLEVGGNSGTFIFPCFKIKVEVDLKAKTTRNRLVISECQAPLTEPRGEHKRYSLMNMNGRSAEATLDGTLTAELGAGVTSLIEDPTIDALEINTYNLLPELKVSAGVGMGVKGIMLQVTDPNPYHFTSAKKGVRKIFKLVTSSNKEVSIHEAQPDVCLWLYSGLYNAGAGVVGEASVASIALKSKGEVGMLGGVTHYTYQSVFSDKQIFKTQTTNMYFQQVYGLAQASASTSSTEKGKKKQYEWVNSLFYESVFMYWQEPEDEKLTSSQLIASKPSGYSRGHTILMDSIDLFYKDNKNNKRIAALSNKLGIDPSIIEKFLKDNESILSDVLKDKNKPDAVFLEATFIPKEESDKSMAITLVDKEGNPISPDENSFKKFKKVFVTDTKSPVKGVLQSLRLRTMIKDSLTLTQEKFKFRLNVGDHALLGFNLGRIEDGGSIKLTDLLITWYDKSGKIVAGPPESYVPTSFLFM